MWPYFSSNFSLLILVIGILIVRLKSERIRFPLLSRGGYMYILKKGGGEEKGS